MPLKAAGQKSDHPIRVADEIRGKSKVQKAMPTTAQRRLILRLPVAFQDQVSGRRLPPTIAAKPGQNASSFDSV